MNDMHADEYEQQMEAIKRAAESIFELAHTEQEVCMLEEAINREIMYLAAIAQTERVKPPEGWDPFGR